MRVQFRVRAGALVSFVLAAALASLLLGTFRGPLALRPPHAGQSSNGHEAVSTLPDGSPNELAGEPEEAGATLAVEEPPLELIETTIGRGGTLGRSLAELGLPAEIVSRVLDRASRFIDLRRLPPRTGIRLSRTAEGAPAVLGVRHEPNGYLRLAFSPRDGSIAGVESIELPVVTRLHSAAGVVETSVAQALSHSAHSSALTLAFADVFQWDVDLLVDPRPGDRVKVAYQVRVLGELPEDLPAFGDRSDRSGDFLEFGRILAGAYEGRMAGAVAFWVEDGKDWGNYFDDEGRPLRKSFLKSPLNYRRISSGFSRARRHPVTRRVVPHHGVDFAARPGTPVASTADGRVTAAGWEGALGRAIKIRHGSEYVTVYGHLKGFARGIRIGTEVRQNQVIGYVGSTGRTTGPHLHYSLLVRGRPVNPLTFKNPPAEPLDPALRPYLDVAVRRWSPLLEAIDPRPARVELASRSLPPAENPAQALFFLEWRLAHGLE